MRTPRRFLFLALLAGLGLARGAVAQSIVPEAELKGLACKGGAFGLRLPSRVEGFRKLGTLLGEESRLVSDYSYGADGAPQHRSHQLRYAGLEVNAVFPLKAPKRGFVESVIVTDRRWNHVLGIKIGSTVSALLANRALPSHLADSPIRFCGSLDGGGDCATVHSENGRISRVEYQCYTG